MTANLRTHFPSLAAWRKRSIRWQERINNTWQNQCKSRWNKLLAYQKLYVVAALGAAIQPLTAAVITLIALSMEYWPRLVQVWQTLAGKAALLFFYVAMTNFALVAAAGLVNEVTGLDAGYFPYSHYTAILLSLPSWTVATCVVVLVFIQLLFPVYLLLIGALRLISAQNINLFANIPYPVTTMCIRFALSWLLLIEGSKLPNYFDGNTTQDNELAEETEVKTPGSDNSTEQFGTKIIITTDVENSDSKTELTLNIHQLLAHFIFHVEANQKSRCELSKGARSIELNEYQHVEISQDEKQTYGYRFDVRACISPGIPEAN